jgi:very-short-patch-repair endonuclease
MRRKYDIDLAVSRLADAQYGIVARPHLAALALGPSAIDRRIRAGRLRPLHRGVYALGHRQLRREAFWLAAVLACGPGAVLSHASAGALWGLRASSATRIDVTAARCRRRPRIRIHRAAHCDAAEITTHREIPVTTPARTLLDLAAMLPRRALERALDEAEQLRLFDLVALHGTLEAHRGRPGAPLLEAVLEHHTAGTTITRSELEEQFLRLCDDHRIARPLTNVRLEGLEVDFHWPALRLVAEVDGYAYHHTRRAFERDRARDAVLTAAHVDVVRFSHRQVTTRPGEIADALAAKGASSSDPLR